MADRCVVMVMVWFTCRIEKEGNRKSRFVFHVTERVSAHVAKAYKHPQVNPSKSFLFNTLSLSLSLSLLLSVKQLTASILANVVTANFI